MFSLKKISLLCFLIAISFISNAQYTNTTNAGSATTLNQALGAYKGKLGFILPDVVADTTAANSMACAAYAGAIIQTASKEYWIRQLVPNLWVKLNTSAASLVSISQAYGILNVPNPIISTGTIGVDTIAMSTRTWRQKGIDSVVGLIGGLTVSPFQELTTSNITTVTPNANLSITGITTLSTLSVTGVLNLGTISQTGALSPIIKFGGVPFINNYVGITGRGRNTFMGINAGNPYGLTNDSYAQTAIGFGSLSSTTTSFSNTMVGDLTGQAIKSGSGNSVLGTVAFASNIIGNDNVSIGHHSMIFDTSGSFNVSVGAENMRNHIDGNRNTSIGSYGLENNLHGKDNVTLGYNAGGNEAGDSTLYIDISNTSLPLIYGQFYYPTRRIDINGNFNVKGEVQSIQSGRLLGALVVGGNVNSTGLTNATRKYGNYSSPHYLSAEVPVATIIADNDVATNKVYIGGNQAAQNAATSIGIYAAANNSTRTGTLIQDIDVNGTVNNGILTTTGNDNYATDISSTFASLTKITKGFADARYAPISTTSYLTPLSATSLIPISPYTNFSVTGTINADILSATSYSGKIFVNNNNTNGSFWIPLIASNASNTYTPFVSTASPSVNGLTGKLSVNNINSGASTYSSGGIVSIGRNLSTGDFEAFTPTGSGIWQEAGGTITPITTTNNISTLGSVSAGGSIGVVDPKGTFLSTTTSSNAVSLIAGGKSANNQYVFQGYNQSTSNITSAITADGNLTTTGNIGAAAAAFTGTLSVTGVANLNGRSNVTGYGTFGNFYTRGANGTESSPTELVNGDILGGWQMAGYNNSTFRNGGFILVTANGTVGTDRLPTKMEFATATDASPSAVTIAMTISNAQLLRFNQYGAGALTTDASGNITATSDGRLKFDKGVFKNALGSIMKLPTGHFYKWKPQSGMETDSTYFSLFANEVHSVLGEAFAPTNKNGYNNLSDRALLSLTIQALQEEKKEKDAQIKVLTDKISLQQADLKILADKLSILEKIIMNKK